MLTLTDREKELLNIGCCPVFSDCKMGNLLNVGTGGGLTNRQVELLDNCTCGPCSHVKLGTKIQNCTDLDAAEIELMDKHTCPLLTEIELSGYINQLVCP